MCVGWSKPVEKPGAWSMDSGSGGFNGSFFVDLDMVKLMGQMGTFFVPSFFWHNLAGKQKTNVATPGTPGCSERETFIARNRFPALDRVPILAREKPKKRALLHDGFLPNFTLW